MDRLGYQNRVMLALSEVDELPNRKKLAIIDSFDDLNAVETEKDVVRDILGNERSAEFYEAMGRVDDVYDELMKRDIHFVTLFDDDYPAKLKEIYDAPAILFFKGSVEALNGDNLIGIVGTRRPTRYGARVAEDFAREFARAGLIVVSGLARGVDGIAHRTCVDEGKPTVGVFACGLDICYPAEHKGLVEGILATGGAVVSEYGLGTKPLQYHFPERNRIISGLCRGVLLAEAASKSGSLITMRLAVEQGRDIFVVPANIYSLESEGSNSLLRQMPHALALSPEDVLNCMNMSAVRQDDVMELSINDQLVLDALHDGELHFEELLAKTGLDVGELNNILLSLQLNGLIDDIGSNYYALK